MTPGIGGGRACHGFGAKVSKRGLCWASCGADLAGGSLELASSTVESFAAAELACAAHPFAVTIEVFSSAIALSSFGLERQDAQR